jgi:hypothetical protein
MEKKEAIERVKNNGWELDELSDDLKKDKDVVLAATSGNEPGAIECADETIRNDKSVMLPLIIQMPTLMQYAGETLKKDKDFVLTVLKESKDNLVNYALEYADESIQSDPELTAQAEANLG